MAAHKQNPAVQGGASRNQLGGWLHLSDTQIDGRTQLLVPQFSLSPAMMRTVSARFHGEEHHD